MFRILAATALLSLTSCAAAYLGAGAAVGAWAYDQNTDEAGLLVLPYQPESVFEAAEAVARRRGEDVVAIRGSMRIECNVDAANVIMQILMVPDRRDVAQLKIRANETWRVRSDIAADLSASIESELE